MGFNRVLEENTAIAESVFGTIKYVLLLSNKLI